MDELEVSGVKDTWPATELQAARCPGSLPLLTECLMFSRSQAELKKFVSVLAQTLLSSH